MSNISYYLDNIRLYISPKIETYSLFSTLRERWQNTDWSSTFNKLKNKSQWVKQRQKLHNKIISDLSNEALINSEQILKISKMKFNTGFIPTLIIVRGQSGAGKSSFINHVLKINTGIVGPDTVRDCLKKWTVLTGKNDNQYDLEAFFVTLWLCKKLISEKKNFTIERTFDYLEDVEILIDDAKKNGYKSIYFVDIDCPLDTSISRLKLRIPGKTNPIVPKMAVIENYNRIKRSRKNWVEFIEKQKDITAIYELYSNSGNYGQFTLMLTVKNSATNRKD